MNRILRKFLFALIVFYCFSNAVWGQAKSPKQPAVQPSAQPISSDLDDNGVPILIKHLPDWEAVRSRAALATNIDDLQRAAGNRRVFEAIDFTGGAEAATADYNSSRMVIVEFQTPQAAIDADQKIGQKIAETGQTAPQTVYRKVGNYAVFVFDAPDEAAANGLIDKVTYEKSVQWLGENPYILINAQKHYVATAGDIILTTVKVAGLSLAAALGLGGLFGALVFYRRRQQQNSGDSYSDAGGMMRLNLDEMTLPQTRQLSEGGDNR